MIIGYRHLIESGSTDMSNGKAHLVHRSIYCCRQIGLGEIVFFVHVRLDGVALGNVHNMSYCLLEWDSSMSLGVVNMT